MAVGFRAAESSPTSGSDVFDSDCPARTVLDKLTSRWGVLILVALRDGPLRFHVLRDRIGGISEKMLSQNLRTFTEYGLAERTVQPTTPPSVSYALTPMGAEAAEQLRGLLRWVGANAETIVEFHARATGLANDATR
ncbi:transcriptional regulator, HxlR family [Nocardia amikacinitolerans]|uniref:Transcriptional regulator, HxlR family n=1 Tax=Nocardia amikacinitolerans TaxID=756689 RepID=A0A285KZ57_9NOCA|nr:helix-turn-helix domain-containing protein [Nocardia amikacinitolerans]SNY77958.1 transcriptional regulator, HxlR family [Nocardia amikacinitolerans]